jgi:anti-anti-sigma regulatory factor
MELTVEQVQNKVPITIIGLHGELDASNFESVTSKAKELYESGARYILLDMSDLSFMSSSGIVALHNIILLLRGEQPHEVQGGWNVFHAIEQDRKSGVSPYVKILNPQPKVASTLQKTGMDEFCEIQTDLQTALASFG